MEENRKKRKKREKRKEKKGANQVLHCTASLNEFLMV